MHSNTIADPFLRFDPSRYQTVSNWPLQTIVSLAKALEAVRPPEAPAHVVKLVDRMHDMRRAAERAMVERLRETNRISSASDVDLDNAVDPLWSLLVRRLGDWSVYARPGLDSLSEAPPPSPELDIEQLRDKATRAGRISTHLFGHGGLGFTRCSYVEQAQLMANILGLIDADGLEEELIELTGPELLPMLRRCQLRYEAMVQARVTKRPSSSADLRALRSRLRKTITRYAGAVITMLDEEQPETLEIVEAALQPMIELRAPSRPVQVVEEDEGEVAGEVASEHEGEDEEAGEVATAIELSAAS